MKFYSRLLILVISVFYIVLDSHSALALEVNVGATGWYAWWKPMWDQVPFFFQVPGTTFEMTERTKDMGPSFLYGPIINISFLDNWSLASTFVWGNQYKATFHSEYTMHIPSFPDQVAQAVEKVESITKYDSDTTLNYRLSKNIKIFTGLKYQGYQYSLDLKGDFINMSAPYKSSLKLISKGIGPGAGVGFSYPLFDSLYVFYNISGLYLRTVWEYSNYSNTSPFFQETPQNVSFNSYGFNSTGAVAYYFDSLQTTLSLGFRYQYLFYRTSDDNKDKTDDKFYGITIAAVYSFSIFE